MKNHIISINNLTKNQLQDILDCATLLKQEYNSNSFHKQVLANKTAVLIFSKPSLRTRLSFEIAIRQLGGNTTNFNAKDIGLGVRESTTDMARVICEMANILICRVCKHKMVEDFASVSSIPVINALSDIEHPCQILADLLTIQEKKGSFSDVTVAYIGDAANNVAQSLTLAAGIYGFNLNVAAPKGYIPSSIVINKVKNQTNLKITADASEAATNADVIYTDTWVSMGQEEEREERIQTFKPYTITPEIMKHAKPDAIFMHDMPAYRGYETTADVIDGPQSVVIDQAANRLHAQKGLLYWMFSPLQ